MHRCSVLVVAYCVHIFFRGERFVASSKRYVLHDLSRYMQSHVVFQGIIVIVLRYRTIAVVVLRVGCIQRRCWSQ